MANSYYDYHYPLELWNKLVGVSQQSRANPVVPVAAPGREWYSQPRPTSAFAVRRRENITVFEVGGTNMVGYTGLEESPSTVRGLVQSDNVTWKVVPYPATIPFRPSWEQGVDTLIDMINETPGRFILVGTSQGAIVTSLVYDQLRTGSLTARRGDLLAGFTFGNPMREAGHTFPDGYDPGGQGIQSFHLSNTESLWWDMANRGDVITSSPKGDTGMWLAALVDLINDHPLDVGELAGLLIRPPANILGIFGILEQALLATKGNAHVTYDTEILPGRNLPSTQIVADRIDEIARERPVVLQNTPDKTEVVTVSFKLPLSVSEVSLEVLRVPCEVELWYRDRSNNWRPALDEQRTPIQFAVVGSNAKSWYKYETGVYPIVAKALQFRFTRTPDPALGSQPYVVGMRNGLIRRNVYDRAAGRTYFEDEQDILGNIITKYVKDWDASKAFDEQPATFWRSGAMPDPQAVVSLYLDVRAADGSAVMIDRLYLDPVYTGQSLNIYYSVDDTVGNRKPSPVALPPNDEALVEWKPDRGRYDTATGSANSYYRVPFNLGPQISRAAWIGVEWSPAFASTAGPGTSASQVLFNAKQAGTTTAWRPKLHYDAGAQKFILSFTNGTTTRTYASSVISRVFKAGEQLRVVAGWRYSPSPEVYLSVRDRTGAEIAALSDHPTTLPTLVSFDGQVEVSNFRGVLTSHVVKLADWSAGGAADYLTNPSTYVSPEPVVPDSQGRLPSTSLDEAVFYADWLLQEHACGGPDESHYGDKEWTPVWRDYVTEKGMLFFPQTYAAKYLKLEFTNLTEEPYPIWESGIQVQYKVFPVSVQQASSQGPRLYTGSGGFLGMGTFLSLNGVRAVNWLNPGSIVNAVNSVFGKTTDPVMIQSGPGYVTDSLPNMAVSGVTNYHRVEAGSDYVYRREQLSPYVVAENTTETIIKAEGLSKIADYTDVPWDAIEAANPGAITHKRSAGALPIRGTDWWIFPGQTMKIPASVMNRLTSTSTVVERKLTSERRVRFNTTSVHRYETRVLKRDSAIAYFAGVREVFPLVSTHLPGVDAWEFNFTQYTNAAKGGQWIYNSLVWQLGAENTVLDNVQLAVMNYLWTSAAPRGVADIYAAITQDAVIAQNTLILALQDLVVKNYAKRIEDLSGDLLYGAVQDREKLVAGPISSVGNTYKIPNAHFISSLRDWSMVGAWTHDTTQGYAGLSQRGCALLEADGQLSTITSSPVPVTAGTKLTVSAWVRWENAVSTSTAKIRLRVLRYGANGYIATDVPTETAATDKVTVTHPTSDGGTSLFTLLTGNYTVPADTTSLALEVAVDAGVTNGQVRVDSAWFYPYTAPVATAFKAFKTLSKFGKVQFDFRDSGPVRSNDMWSRPNSDQLAYYVEMTTIPPGFWGDFVANWSDSTAVAAARVPSGPAVTWGAPVPLVSVVVDADRLYQGKRVLHFRRAAGAGQAGVKVRQWTNYVGKGLVRIGFVAQKPYDNDNQVILRLRRCSDGVVVYEESVKMPYGRWWEYHSRWREVPEGPDQVYTVELSLSGDAEDELYLSDLYTEVSHVRYFVQLGSGDEAVLHEVTDLRNTGERNSGTAYVTSTKPVNEFTVQAQILSPAGWAYGVTATPSYLR